MKRLLLILFVGCLSVATFAQRPAMMFGDTDKAFKAQPEEIKGWGYSDAGGATIHQLFAPFVPEGYDFISEVATILGESVAVLERDAQAVAETDTDSTENGATEGE